MPQQESFPPITNTAPSAKSSAPPAQWRRSTPSFSQPSIMIGRLAFITTVADITTQAREDGHPETQGRKMEGWICMGLLIMTHRTAMIFWALVTLLILLKVRHM